MRGLCGGLYIKEGIVDPAPPYCEDGPKDVQSIPDRFTVCRNIKHGQTRLIWKTVGTSSAGLDDDEYYIQVLQDREIIWTSKQLFDEASGDSGSELLGSADGGDFVVNFDCDLENPFASCEGKYIGLKPT